jgi:hypothetical protein
VPASAEHGAYEHRGVPQGLGDALLLRQRGTSRRVNPWRERLRVNRMIRFVHYPLDRLGAAPTLRSAAEIAKEPAYCAQRVAGCYCNSYLVVAEDIARADDHRNRSNRLGLRSRGESGGGDFTAFRIPAP